MYVYCRWLHGVALYVVSNFSLEGPLVVVMLICSYSVQRIVERNQIGEQGVQTPDYVLQRTSRQPATPIERMLPQNTEADFPVLGNVRVPDLCLAVRRRRLDVVLSRNFDFEYESTPSPETLTWADDEGERTEVVYVPKL